jgi:hypothetical protein
MKNINCKQLGVSGLRRYGPYIYEEFLPELRWPRAGKIYQEMSDNDAVIGAVLYLAEMLIRGVEWRVEPASDSAEDKEHAEFLKSCMNDMDTSWANVISEILSMLAYGFSFHEIVYKIRRGPDETRTKYRSKYTDGRIGWRGLPIRAQTSLDGWEFDDEGNVVTFIQRCEPNFNTVKIPMSKGLLFRTRVSKDNPEGKSLLRNAYRSWFFKKHFEEIEGIGIERDLAGFPVLTAPEGLDLWNDEDPKLASLRVNAETLVASIRNDSEAGILLPHGWNLELLTSGSSRQIDIGATIERYDNRIAITLLSDIILLGNKSGSFALAESKQSLLAASLQSQLNNIADVFNTKAVPSLFRLNNITDLSKLPKITPTKIQAPTLAEVALVLRSMGLDISGDRALQGHLRRILCMPELDDETFKTVYENQTAKPASDLDDTTDKLLEQNDAVYT